MVVDVDADDVDVEVAICKWIAVVVEAPASDCLPDSACHSPTENPHCTLACTLSAGGGQCGLPLRASPTRYGPYPSSVPMSDKLARASGLEPIDAQGWSLNGPAPMTHF